MTPYAVRFRNHKYYYALPSVKQVFYSEVDREPNWFWYKAKNTPVTSNCQRLMDCHWQLKCTIFWLHWHLWNCQSQMRLRHQHENVQMKTLSRIQSIRQLLWAGNIMNWMWQNFLGSRYDFLHPLQARLQHANMCHYLFKTIKPFLFIVLYHFDDIIQSSHFTHKIWDQ